MTVTSIAGMMAGVMAAIALSACSGESAGGPTGSSASAPPPAAQGARLYAQNCAPCHQENGQGVANVYPSLVGSPAVLGDPVELSQWVLNQKRPASIPAGRYSTLMLLFGWLKDDDAAALLTYIRTTWGNVAPAVDAQTVNKSRPR